MKDAYSFEMNEEGLDISYGKMKEAYKNIFSGCGLDFSIQQADSGVIGGKFSEEFVAKGECPELEVGHIFKLGTQYSESMKAFFVDRNGEEKPFIMGCYGIGVSRIVAAAIEGNYDEKGIIWPVSIAPFKVIVIPANTENSQMLETAEKLYKSFTDSNIEVLLDDRNESAGSKFADADLCGIPLWVIVGRKITEGKAEIRIRRGRKSEDVETGRVIEWVSDFLNR